VRRPRRLLLLAVPAAAAFSLGACSAAGGTLQQRVASWAGQSGIVSLDAQVADDVSSFRQALAAGETGTARDLCSSLNDDAGAAYDELPSPDRQLTGLLNAADTALDQGAVDCEAALGGKRDLLATALREIREGSASLRAADLRLQSFGVSTASTGATGQGGGP
jgi:hypothetical protein